MIPGANSAGPSHPIMDGSLVVNEIYLSLQGESTWAGLPCVFVRLTACPLRCSYCDTAYAFAEGSRVSCDEVLSRTEALAKDFGPSPTSPHRLPLVEFTGGEPLAQANTPIVLRELCDRGYTVLLETSGALDISPVDTRVHRIVDLKCPSSGESQRNRLENIPLLTSHDELKFVIQTQEDYEWSKEMMNHHGLADRCTVLFSWASPLAHHQRHPSLKPAPSDHQPMSRRDLAEAIIRDRLPVRFQVQMHKVIWPPDERGV